VKVHGDLRYNRIMAKVNYAEGDVIQYRTLDGSVRTVLVEAKDDDIKNGRPGFAGAQMTNGVVRGELGCWGYDDQVIRVVQKCKSAGI
jgi:hypothetical protein